MIASDDGLDTALARALHSLGSVNLRALQAGLEEVRQRRERDPSLSLALLLSERGQATSQDIDAAFALIDEAQAPAHQAALSRLGIPNDLGPYRVVRELSRGGMGAVHEIVHESSGVAFALKTILPELSDTGGEELERFAREAFALGQLNHPHVVRVHAARVAGPVPYMIVDLLPGGTLQARIEGEPWEPKDALELTRKLGEGLAHAHAKGILHRDLKPLNVLFDDRDEPRLVDFGLTRLLSGSSLTQSGQLLGTPSYMAPEQATGGAVDERTDLYGLAGVLFALLTGRPPFEGHGLGVLASVVHDPPPRASKLARGVPSWLDEVLAKALAKDPAARYPDVPGFLAALANGVAPRRERRRPPRWLTTLLVLSGVVGLGITLHDVHRRSLASAARAELASKLRASGSVLALREHLGAWREALGGAEADLLLAEGLVALAQADTAQADTAQAGTAQAGTAQAGTAQAGTAQAGAAAKTSAEPEGADRERLTRLGELDPGAARFLEACWKATRARQPDELKSVRGILAGRQERVRGEVQPGGRFVELELWRARAELSSGDAGLALATFVRAGPRVAEAPYAGEAARAAFAAAERASASDLRALASVLPGHTVALSRQAAWLEFLEPRELAKSQRPFLQALSEGLAAEGQPPPALEAWLRTRARAELKRAHFPQAFADKRDHEIAGKPLLGLRIEDVRPVSIEVYGLLSHALRVVRALRLDDLSSALQVSCQSALRTIDSHVNDDENTSRAQLGLAYMASFPQDRAWMGQFAHTGPDYYPRAGAMIAEAIADLAIREPEPNRGLLLLWSDWIRMSSAPPHDDLGVREAYFEESRRRLEARVAWVERYANDTAQLETMAKDPLLGPLLGACSKVGGLYVVYRTALLSAYLRSKRLNQAIAVAEGADLTRSGLRSEYAWALHTLSHDDARPAPERALHKETLRIFLRRVVPGATTSETDFDTLMDVSWYARDLFEGERGVLYETAVRRIDSGWYGLQVMMRLGCLAQLAERPGAARAHLAQAKQWIEDKYLKDAPREELLREFDALLELDSDDWVRFEHRLRPRLVQLTPLPTAK